MLPTVCTYSEVPNRRADRNKRAGLEKKCHPACLLLSKSINEQGGIFRLLHEKLRAGWKENLTNLSEHALLLGTSEYYCSNSMESLVKIRWIGNLNKFCAYCVKGLICLLLGRGRVGVGVYLGICHFQLTLFLLVVRNKKLLRI